MSAFELLFTYDALVFLGLGLLAAVFVMILERRRLDRVRAVDLMLATFLFFSGTVRFLLLFLKDLFFPELDGAVAAVAWQTVLIGQLAFAELGIAVLCLFGLRGSVAVRTAATVPLAVTLIGSGIAWVVLAMHSTAVSFWPPINTFGAVAAGLFGLLLLALDWANRSDAPDPLEPGGKSYTY